MRFEPENSLQGSVSLDIDKRLEAERMSLLTI